VQAGSQKRDSPETKRVRGYSICRLERLHPVAFQTNDLQSVCRDDSRIEDCAECCGDISSCSAECQAAVDDDEKIKRNECAFDAARVPYQESRQRKVRRDLQNKLKPVVQPGSPKQQKDYRECKRRDVEKREKGEWALAFREKAERICEIQPQ